MRGVWIIGIVFALTFLGVSALELNESPNVLTLKLDDNNCKILNCLQCHKGITGEVCDQCKDGWGVDKKTVGDDLCVQCSSIIDHCNSCNNVRIWWNCLACDDGYRVLQNEFSNDLCIKTNSQTPSESSKKVETK